MGVDLKGLLLWQQARKLGGLGDETIEIGGLSVRIGKSVAEAHILKKSACYDFTWEMLYFKNFREYVCTATSHLCMSQWTRQIKA